MHKKERVQIRDILEKLDKIGKRVAKLESQGIVVDPTKLPMRGPYDYITEEMNKTNGGKNK